jgi:hypothetical protein
MLHSYIAGSRGRTYSSPCYITCRSYTLYGFQDKRINGRKHLPWTYKRLPRHHISPSSKTRSRRKQIQHQQCVKKASSSGPAAAPTSKTHARFRNKVCDGYAFTWAYRTPIPFHTSLRCPSCIRADEATALRQANEALLATSSAYPTLKSVATGDDSHRVRAGRPRYSRTPSGTQILDVPANWTSEMNRLPSNANEFSAFLAGKFDPLVKLPDTHLPLPQTPRASSLSKPTKLNMGVRDMPVPMQRSRSHAPPQCWQGPVVLGEDDYPYVEFRGTLSTRPGASRRPSYTGRVLEKGWAPPSSGTLPPQSDVDTAPPSQVPSPQLKVSPPRLRITRSE